MTPKIHKVTHDKEACTAYIYLTEIGDGEVDRSVPVNNTPLILDFDSEGTLLGIESLDTDAFPPVVVEQAVES